jgi:hypothetical protein
MTSSHDDLEARAKDYVEHLPAETALGNADPAGGVDTDPEPIDRAAAEKPQH